MHRRGSFFNSVGEHRTDSAALWKWAIKKVIFQVAVGKTRAFLERRHSQGTPRPVPVAGRDWDDWLDKEISVLSGRLDAKEIDQATFDRRVALLEARWSQNV